MTDQEWEENKQYFKVTREGNKTTVRFWQLGGVVETEYALSPHFTQAEKYLINDAADSLAEYVRDGIRRALADYRK